MIQLAPGAAIGPPSSFPSGVKLAAIWGVKGSPMHPSVELDWFRLGPPLIDEDVKAELEARGP